MKKNISQKTKGRFYIISTALLWGLAGVCVKSIPWNSFSIMTLRCAIGVVMFGIVRKSFKIRPDKKTFFGSVMMSLTGLLYMSSIKLTTAATAIVLQYIAPILVFLFTVIVQKIKPKLTEALIVLAVFGGCVLSFADGLDPTRFLGNILGLLSGFTFAAQIIIFSDPKTDPTGGMYLSNLISCVTCLPFMFFDKALSFEPKAVFCIIILGVFQYGLANIFYAKGCTLLSKTETSLLLTIEPIFNPIPVWIVTGEKMGAKALAGFFIVIIAITLYGLLPAMENKRTATVKK